MTKKRILLVVCSVGIVVVGFLLVYSMRFRVVGSSLADNIYPIGSSEVVYFFNKELDTRARDGDLLITTEPAYATNTKVDKKTLHIWFSDPPKKDFTITIKNIKSSGGDKISAFTQKYTAKELGENDLSKYELDRRTSYVDQGVDKPTIAENYLPIDVSPQYRIEYGKSKKYPNDVNKGAIYISSASLRDKSDAIQMIYDIGYDPSDYELIFQPLR